LCKKRKKEAAKESDDEGSNSEMEVSIKRQKLNENNKFKTNTHFVKFSGEEYKSKKGKGDIIKEGKYEPFAYIKLNPKATQNKNKKNYIKLFEKIMNPSKGSQLKGIKFK